MDRVAELLAQFPGPVTLKPSLRKWIGFLAAAGLFIAGGIAQTVSSSSSGILDWLSVGVLGAMFVGATFAIFFGRLRLVLDREGFTIRVARRSERWLWTDVGDFAVADYLHGAPGANLRKRVGFNDTRINKSTSQRVGEQVSALLTGRDCALPEGYGATSFGLPMEDLVRLLSHISGKIAPRARSRLDDPGGPASPNRFRILLPRTRPVVSRTRWWTN